MQDAFEKKFLAATEKLYAAEGQKLINDLSVPGYLTHCGKYVMYYVVCSVSSQKRDYERKTSVSSTTWTKAVNGS